MNFLIVDTCYYNFYRFYATSMWYKRAYPDETFDNDYNWSENTVFWEKFKKKVRFKLNFWGVFGCEFPANHLF